MSVVRRFDLVDTFGAAKTEGRHSEGASTSAIDGLPALAVPVKLANMNYWLFQTLVVRPKIPRSSALRRRD